MNGLTPLRLARLKSGLSQFEAALKAGLSQTIISLMERELKEPTPKQLDKLSRVYRFNLKNQSEAAFD